MSNDPVDEFNSREAIRDLLEDRDNYSKAMMEEEKKVFHLLAENSRLRLALEGIAEFDCVSARHSVKCDGNCPPCMACAALNWEVGT